MLNWGKITIQVDPMYYSGKQFIIEINNNSSEHPYIQSAQLEDKPLDKAWFYHKDWSNKDAGLRPSSMSSKISTIEETDQGGTKNAK